MTDTSTLFLAVSMPTVVSLIGIVWNRADMQAFRLEFRSEINGIKSEITNIRERLASIETTLKILWPKKNDEAA
jgi:hypothetical protein